MRVLMWVSALVQNVTHLNQEDKAVQGLALPHNTRRAATSEKARGTAERRRYHNRAILKALADSQKTSYLDPQWAAV